jgi:hypothetical protein
LEDAVALNEFVKASEEAFAVFAIASGDLQQGCVLPNRSWPPAAGQPQDGTTCDRWAAMSGATSAMGA